MLIDFCYAGNLKIDPGEVVARVAARVAAAAAAKVAAVVAEAAAEGAGYSCLVDQEFLLCHLGKF